MGIIKDMVIDAKKTALDIGEGLHSGFIAAKKDIAESRRGLVMYTPEDFSHDYFKMLGKINDMEMTIKQKEKEIDSYVDPDELHSIKDYEVIPSTVIFTKNSFFIVGSVSMNYKTIIDIHGVERVIDESTMFIRIKK